MNQTPAQLRQHFRQQRRQLSADEQTIASVSLLKQIQTHQLIDNDAMVALYLANDGEIDPINVIHYCWQHNIRVCLPVLHPVCQGHLSFQSYTPDTSMANNRFGIAEPTWDCRDVVPLSDIDYIFTPLVAFDKSGNRLGMGGGFYDRTLAPLKSRQFKTKLYGLAHECQQSEQLATQPWDVPLHAIITPSQLIRA
ncbi:5-formyltetrahydrofolate cyclo-ligase [Neptunicella marina]|uniref:5-formyltetrahydrofolate cyclo-ligase n=1 Tax=Neptunicella marina TaxID=2125989 RepID=A0A8J6M3B9_9ALTE|nr:5-formyltetrahydrofolate cyclo-ligase [Neptunicella marina]MBC3766852.1 5-formyltetrahydrofolate cyclo-ligase [Neptunicella marina]